MDVLFCKGLRSYMVSMVSEERWTSSICAHISNIGISLHLCALTVLSSGNVARCHW